MQQSAPELTLYYSPYCGFCVRVLRAIQALGVEMELRDVSAAGTGYRRELVQGGGRGMVPCLRITRSGDDDLWMYESMDIIAYLEERFGPSSGSSRDERAISGGRR